MDLFDESHVLDLNADLLDRQVVDSADVPVCKVDDLELTCDESGRWVVSAILVGAAALGPRFQGPFGATLAGLARRWRGQPQPAPPRIPWRDVARVGSDVRLAVPGEALPDDLSALETWLRSHVLARIPGSRHASG